MNPKTINIIYWSSTLLFSLLMIFSAIPNAIVNEDSVKLVHNMLGYPVYFIPFIGFAKIAGAVVILIPGLNKIKEWGYAGLFFDLAAAVYSGIAVAKGVDPLMLFMLIWIIPGVLSCYYWNKKNNIIK
jgi:hypothetical protein